MRVLLTALSAVCLPLLAQTDPDATLQALLAEAHEAQAKGELRGAADAYRRAVAIRPEAAELWSNLGLMEYEAHAYPEAEKSLRRALRIDQSLFVPNLFLGLDLLELKRSRQAVPYLQAAEKLNPKDIQVPLALGRAFHMLLDPARSREWYQRATELAPGNSAAWFGLGVAYLGLAETASTKLIAEFPQSQAVAELRAEALRKQLGGAESPAEHAGPREEAAEALAKQVRDYGKLGGAALERAGELEPNSPRIHALLGDAYQQRKMFREAQEEYTKMLALDPGSIAGLAGLTGAFLADGQLAIAESTARKGLARDAADGEINLLMGEILVAEHKYAEAEPFLERSLNVRPDLLARAHALRGRVFARTGRQQQAIDELRLGLASDEDGSVYYQLARLYQSSGDARAAAEAFKKSQQMRARRDRLPQPVPPL